MKRLDTQDLQQMPSRARAHLVNNLSGVKGLHLMGTCSANGIDNLALFNSVLHIGANPALLGVLFRPTTVRRDSYRNLQTIGEFTLNLVTRQMVDAAHATSAKWPEDQSEFTATGLTPWRSDTMKVPFVEESPVRIGLRLVDEQPIRCNDTRLVIGEVTELWLPENLPEEDGWLRLDHLDVMSVAGLDAYYRPELMVRKAYARPEVDARDSDLWRR